MPPHGWTPGGNDTLTGGSSDDFSASNTNTNTLYGDAFEMDDNARGGNDTLTGGDGPGFRFGPFFRSHQQPYGDANSMHNSARGGDDTLTGGDGSENNLSATPASWTAIAVAATTR